MLGVSFLPPFVALNESLPEYLGVIGWAAMPGLAFGGTIDCFVPEGSIIRAFGGRGIRTLPCAVVAGPLRPAQPIRFSAARRSYRWSSRSAPATRLLYNRSS